MKTEPTGTRWPHLLVLFIACQVGAVLLVIGAEMVPDRWVADALLDGIDRGLVSEEHFPVTGLGIQVDRWSECVALTVGLGDPATSNNIQTGLSSPSLGRCAEAVPRLLEFRETDVLRAERFYFRYWHGYTVITRPGMAMFGVDGARTLIMGMAAAAALTLAVVVARATSVWVSVALLSPLVLTTDFFDLGESAPHGIVVATTLLLAAGVWKAFADPPDRYRLLSVAILAGAVSSFLEFMFLIPGTLCLLTMIFAARVHGHGQRGRQLWVQTLTFGAVWFLSFALTWATRWVVAAPVVGWRWVLDDIKDTFLRRLDAGSTAVADGLGAATGANFEAWLDKPLTILVPVLVVILVMAVVKGFHQRRFGLDYVLLLLLVSLIPLVWFEVVSNHSWVHAWFTYRALPLALGALAAAVLIPGVIGANLDAGDST